MNKSVKTSNPDPKQKVMERKYVGFTKAMMDVLEAEKARIAARKGHCTETEALESLMLPRPYWPIIERFLQERMELIGSSREEVVQMVLWEFIQQKSPAPVPNSVTPVTPPSRPTSPEKTVAEMEQAAEADRAHG